MIMGEYRKKIGSGFTFPFYWARIQEDIWSGHEFWEPILWSHNELLTLREKLSKGVMPEDHQRFLTYCSDYIWHRLTNLSNMYEELVREWFMPTYLAMLTSYPPRESDEASG